MVGAYTQRTLPNHITVKNILSITQKLALYSTILVAYMRYNFQCISQVISNKYHCFSGNHARKFPPARQFLTNCHMKVFPRACTFTFVANALCRLFNIWCDPTVSSCLYVLFVDTNLQQSEGLVPHEWARNHGRSLQRVCTATDERLFWVCLLWRLMMTFSLSVTLLWCLVLRCFGV